MSLLSVFLVPDVAKASKQDISNASLASIDSKFPAIVSGGVPVTLPAGLATSALQGTGNTSLASIDTKLTKGQQNAANSLSVVLSSDGPFAANFGVQADAAATSDTGSFSFMAFVKRLLSRTPALGPATPAASSPVIVAPRQEWRTEFAKAVANGVDNAWLTLIAQGGHAVSQTAGKLQVVASTATNDECIIRSSVAFSGVGLYAMVQALLSQRIANQSFFVELVDVIGDALSLTVNSATSVTVTLPNGVAMDAGNVGQSINIGAISGVAGVPGKWTIASVSGQNVTFTVAGWPATGAGTCSLFGWNYHRVEFNSTVATTAQYDAGKNGYGGGNTAITVNNTGANGTSLQVGQEDGMGFVSDFTGAVNSGATAGLSTIRASRASGIPDPTVALYLQLRVLNGTVAPASATTFSTTRASISAYTPVSVSIQSIRPMSLQQAMPVAMTSTSVVSSTGAQATAVASNAVRVGSRASTAAVVVTTGQNIDLISTLYGAVTQKPYSIPELDWNYASAAGGIVNTTDVAIKAAAGAGIRNYVTAMQLSNASATATEVVLKDGAAVIWRGNCPANCPNFPVDLPSPLKSTANTALNFACITTGAAVYVNAQGYIAP